MVQLIFSLKVTLAFTLENGLKRDELKASRPLRRLLHMSRQEWTVAWRTVARERREEVKSVIWEGLLTRAVNGLDLSREGKKEESRRTIALLV